MKNKTFIIMRLERLFEIMDARQIVEIYALKEDDTNYIIRSGFVYEFMVDDDFIKKYGRENIIGINSGLSKTQILIEEVLGYERTLRGFRNGLLKGKRPRT